jgi:hypothetical protein
MAHVQNENDFINLICSLYWGIIWKIREITYKTITPNTQKTQVRVFIKANRLLACRVSSLYLFKFAIINKKHRNRILQGWLWMCAWVTNFWGGPGWGNLSKLASKKRGVFLPQSMHLYLVFSVHFLVPCSNSICFSISYLKMELQCRKPSRDRSSLKCSFSFHGEKRGDDIQTDMTFKNTVLW